MLSGQRGTKMKQLQKKKKTHLTNNNHSCLFIHFAVLMFLFYAAWHLIRSSCFAMDFVISNV